MRLDVFGAWDSCELSDLIEAPVFSYQVGAMKPEPAIYAEALRRGGVHRLETGQDLAGQPPLVQAATHPKGQAQGHRRGSAPRPGNGGPGSVCALATVTRTACYGTSVRRNETTASKKKSTAKIPNNRRSALRATTRADSASER